MARNRYSYPPQYQPRETIKERAGKFVEKVILLFAGFAAVILVFWFLIKTSETPKAAAGMNTPTPTVEKITAVPEKKAKTAATVTPAPDFLKTQTALNADIAKLNAETAALENEKAAYLAGIQADREKAESENRQRELDQAYKMGELEYAEKLDAINHNREIYALELTLVQDLNAAKVEKTIQENVVKIKNLDRREGMITGIITFFVIGIAVLAIVILALFIITVIRNYQATKPEPPKEVKLNIFNPETKQSRFDDIPITENQLRTWATAVINGQTLGYKFWVEETSFFKRKEFEILNDVMLKNRIIEYVNGQENQGKVGTRAGIASLKQHLNDPNPGKNPLPRKGSPPPQTRV